MVIELLVLSGYYGGQKEAVLGGYYFG